MPVPIPESLQGFPTAHVRAALPERSRFTLCDHDWGTFILACDHAEVPGDRLDENLRHKYALDGGNVTRDDMVQLLANLDAFATADVPDNENDPAGFRERQEQADSWVRDFLHIYGLEAV